MNSIESVMFQLTCGYICETAIPTQYLENPEIISAIQRYMWLVGQTHTNGWTSLYKIINYSD